MALPCSREPLLLPLKPPKGTWGSAPAVCELTWTMPASISFTKRRARPRSRVTIDALRPNRVWLARRTASSKSFASMIPTTGPKISSWAMRMSGPTRSKTVGATK